MSDRARLYVLSGPDVGRSFTILSHAVIGRGSECEVRLRGTSISRRHARLDQTAAGWVIQDLDSTNGVGKDGRRIERARVDDHDELLLGEVRIRFRLAAGSASANGEGETASGAGLRSDAARQMLREEAPEGFLSGELGQRPVWIQALLIAVAVALAAGLFWLSFQAALGLRGGS